MDEQSICQRQENEPSGCSNKDKEIDSSPRKIPIHEALLKVELVTMLAFKHHITDSSRFGSVQT